MKPSFCAGVLFAGVAVAAASLPVHAQNYPNRPVRVIVGIAPGGGMDAISRAVSQKLGESLGQTFVVDNRPGAGGNIAMEMAASANADGHNLLIISATSVIHPILYKTRFDVAKDFAPVSQITAQGYMVAVHPSVPARNMNELVQHAKAHPGKLNFASSGIGSPMHLIGELFMAATGTKIVHVPYKGIGPAYADLLAGNVELSFPALLSAQPHVRAGKLRALAVTTPKRAQAMPDLPTIGEAGVPGVVVVNWYGMMAPRNTPKAIVERLSREVKTGMSQPDVTKRLAVEGSEAVGSTPEQFAAFIIAERDKWTKVVKDAGIRAQ